MSRRVALALAIALAMACASCSSGSIPAVTVTATVTVTAATSAETSATPSAGAQSPVAPGNLGLVWASAVDDARVNRPVSEQPKFDAGRKLESSIDAIIYVDASTEGDLSKGCADEIESSGKSSDTHCLLVQFAMNVPSSYRAEEAGLAPGPLLNPDGRQIEKATVTDGVPGAKHVTIAEFYAGGTPGSTLRWDVGSNEQGWKTMKYRIPKLDAFLPINFS